MLLLRKYQGMLFSLTSRAVLYNIQKLSILGFEKFYRIIRFRKVGMREQGKVWNGTIAILKAAHFPGVLLAKELRIRLRYWSTVYF